MIPVHYTTGEAAKISRRHIVTIRLDLEDGTLHGFQRVPGGRWVISEPCLEAYMQGSNCEHQGSQRLRSRRMRKGTGN